MEVGKIRTLWALILKFVATTAAAWIAFGLLDDSAFASIITFGIVATILNYLIGDLYILPNYGNVVASIADGVLGGLVAYLWTFADPAFRISFLSLLIFAVLVVIAEYYFHAYLLRAEKVEPSPE